MVEVYHNAPESQNNVLTAYTLTSLSQHFSANAPSIHPSLIRPVHRRVSSKVQQAFADTLQRCALSIGRQCRFETTFFHSRRQPPTDGSFFHTSDTGDLRHDACPQIWPVGGLPAVLGQWDTSQGRVARHGPALARPNRLFALHMGGVQPTRGDLHCSDIRVLRRRLFHSGGRASDP
jgi:hypothetical protein